MIITIDCSKVNTVMMDEESICFGVANKY